MDVNRSEAAARPEPKEPQVLLDSLEGFVECLRELEIVLEDKPEKLSTHMGKVFEHLKTIDQNKDVNVQFPLEVFGCIDHDWNPDLYTSEVVRSAEANLKNTTAKVDAYATFKQTLSRQMDEVYPGERDMFMNLIKEAEEKHKADAKRAAETQADTEKADAKPADGEEAADAESKPVTNGESAPTDMDADP